MPDEIFAKLEGLDELRRVLKDSPGKIRKRAVRGAARKAVLPIKRAAQANAPVLKTPAPYRSPGTIKRSIVVRPSKIARRQGDEGVYVGVAYSKANKKKYGKRSAKNPHDPFYWWWQEFGWVAGGGRIRGGKVRRELTRQFRLARGIAKKIPGKFFMARAVRQHGEPAIQTFIREVVPQIEKLNRKAL